MKALKLWGWILFILSSALFWAGILNGDFTGHEIYKMNNGALVLFLLSTIFFLLAITIWAVVRAMKENQTDKFPAEKE